MAKVIRHINDKQKDFVDTMKTLTYSRATWEVWSDFITMYAIALSNAVDKAHFDKREKLYLEIINKYNKKEQQVFPKLCALVALAFEQDRDQDFLGELYMALELGNHWKGQFFTPYCVCRAMSEITVGDIAGQIQKNGYITANDCACGAGALLIAFANTAQRKLSDENINYQNHILFTAQDIDMITGLMCYIQLSLLGCAGYIKLGDSLIEPMTEGEALRNLSMPESYYWYTPMYFSEVWHWRRQWRIVDRMMRSMVPKKSALEEKEEITVPVETKSGEMPNTPDYEICLNENGQYSLF